MSCKATITRNSESGTAIESLVRRIETLNAWSQPLAICDMP